MELKINGLSKSYGNNKALSSFSMTFTPGIYALLGPNGSGKSTLMNLITGNLTADEGSITYDGEDVGKMGAAFREKLGFMPQYPGLYPTFSVEEFLWYMATLKGMTKERAASAIPAVLEAVELSDVARHKVRSLSGGMKQRLALAQATMGDPEIIILDEPTAGLDPKQRIAVRNYISQIALNKIVLIATHVVSDIEYMAGDVILLKKGVIADHGSPQKLVEKMEGKTWSVLCPERNVSRLSELLHVTGIAKEKDGDVALSFISDRNLTGHAAPRTPTLEDYYLYIFGGATENE